MCNILCKIRQWRPLFLSKPLRVKIKEDALYLIGLSWRRNGCQGGDGMGILLRALFTVSGRLFSSQRKMPGFSPYADFVSHRQERPASPASYWYTLFCHWVVPYESKSLMVYSHQRFLLCCFDFGWRSKYIVIFKPSVHLILNQCFRKYISGLPPLHGPDSFHLSNTSATSYSVSRHINRLGRAGSPWAIPAVSNVPSTGLINSLTNSSVIQFTSFLYGVLIPQLLFWPKGKTFLCPPAHQQVLHRIWLTILDLTVKKKLHLPLQSLPGKIR